MTVDITKDDPNQLPVVVQIVPLTFQEFQNQGGTLPPEISGIFSTVTPARCETVVLILTASYGRTIVFLIYIYIGLVCGISDY